MRRFLRSAPFTSLLVLLALLGFSYHPVVTFGTQDGVHLDGSFIYIITLVTVLTSSGIIWHNRHMLFRNKAWLILIAFSVYATLSILWSANPLRATITSAFLWLMTAVSTTLAVQLPALKKNHAMVWRLVAGGLFACGAWALWQIIGDAMGVSPVYTLLPEAYRSSVFGFARPIAFALEPQFLASLLLAPFGWLLHTFLKAPSLKTGIGLTLTVVVLVLTMSRGGLLAAGAITLILVAIQYQRWRVSLIGMVSIAIGTIGALLIMATAANINHRDMISGYQAVTKSVNHLSLGVLSLPEQKTPKTLPIRQDTRKSDGYVEASTTSRLSMSHEAFDLWRKQSSTLLFGVGIGGFGQALHYQNASYPVGSVANNYFLEMLAELGLIGTAIFTAFLALLFFNLITRRQVLLTAILSGFLVQWCFFSGNANVIHIWVVIGIALATSAAQRRRLIQ